jgi:subtilisin family serine protease
MFRASSIAAILLAVAVTATAQPQPPAQGGRYFVEFDTLGPAAANAIRAAGGTTVHEFPEFNVIAARLPDAAVQALRNNPRVRSITDDVPRYPFSTQTVPYGISMVQADQFSAGAGIGQAKVCVIDSGFNVGHEDLLATLVKGTNNSGTGNWYQDRCGHGTHVAGTIAAVNNGVGVVGVLPDGNLPMHIVKVFGDSCAWTYSSDLINALNTCRSNGAKVVSMSLGGAKPIGPWEERAFNDAYTAGVLSIAAAGNAGTTALSYPASYNSVVSVAAIDTNKVVADFSQKNSAVELAAPGVAVRSTVPYIDTNTLSISGGPTFSGSHVDASGRTTGATGTLTNGGLCTSAGSWSGHVVLCARGENSFKAKVDNVRAGGGVAAVIYNNVSGGFIGTCDDGTGTSCVLTGMSISQEDGQAAVAYAGTSSTVVSHITYDVSSYEEWNGTSMATPHVSGVAALVWSHNPAWTNAQIRQALQQTAEDLGAAGRDTSYGFGLVRAKAALCALAPTNPACTGGTPTNNPPSAGFTFTAADLTASFTDTSTDSDGTVVSWAWHFGNGSTSTVQNPSHTYAAAGTYTVTLTVTDNGGATASTSRSVTVSSSTPPPQGITLSVVGSKVQGLQKADLTWSGSTATSMDVFRNSVKVATVSNTGGYRDNINVRGGGSYTYRVCDAGTTTTCSNSVTITF